MTIEGVPEGWELVRIGKPVTGEWSIGGDGNPWQYVKEAPSTEFWPIIRKAAPVCIWPHGVFKDGWIAEDLNGDQYWYTTKPESDGEDEWANEGDCRFVTDCMLPVQFRSDLTWTQRIQRVGPLAEKSSGHFIR